MICRSTPVSSRQKQSVAVSESPNLSDWDNDNLGDSTDDDETQMDVDSIEQLDESPGTDSEVSESDGEVSDSDGEVSDDEDIDQTEIRNGPKDKR